MVKKGDNTRYLYIARSCVIDCLNRTVRSSAYQKFIADNARSIFAHDQNGMHQFGFSWAGPWDFKNGATEATEGSALSGLNANIGGKSPASC